MQQFVVLTVQGKIVRSIPELPLFTEQLNYVNTDNGTRIIDRLTNVMPGIIDCQVVTDKINWDTDTVLHIITQQ